MILYMIVAGFKETTTETTGHLFWKKTTAIHHPLSERDIPLTAAIILTIFALLLLLLAIKIVMVQGRYTKYLGMIKNNSSISVKHLTSIVRLDFETVREEIFQLFSFDELSDYYYDLNKDLIVKVTDEQFWLCSYCRGTNPIDSLKCTKCGADRNR